MSTQSILNIFEPGMALAQTFKNLRQKEGITYEALFNAIDQYFQKDIPGEGGWWLFAEHTKKESLNESFSWEQFILLTSILGYDIQLHICKKEPEPAAENKGPFMPIDVLNLPVRITNALGHGNDIWFVKDLVVLTEEQLLKKIHIGPKALTEIIAALNKLGLKLAM